MGFVSMKNGSNHNTLGDLIDQIRKKETSISCRGLSGSDRAYLVARINQQLKTPVIVVVDTPEEAEKFIKDLRFFSPSNESDILYFPVYHLLPFKSLSYHNEIATIRIRTLFQLISSQVPYMVVTTPGGLMQRLIPKEEMNAYVELVMAGEDIDRDQLVEKLIAGGYTRTGIVEEPGDFCVRGGILDIYSPMYEDPLRLELFGDMVESLRFFSAVNQRKLSSVDEAIILPAKEIILKKSSVPDIISRVRERASHLEIPVTRVREIIERISKEGIFPGIESLIPLIYRRMDTLTDYLPGNTLHMLVEPDGLVYAGNEYESLVEKNFEAACSERRICVEPRTLYAPWSEIQKKLKTENTIFFNDIRSGTPWENDPGTAYPLNFDIADNADISENLKYHRGKEKPLSPLISWIKSNRSASFMTLLLCNGKSQADRLRSLLRLYEIQADMIPEFPGSNYKKGTVHICRGQIGAGFVWPDEGLAVITEDEIFGKKHRKLNKPRREIRSDLLTVEDLKKDDLVVHADHGIGCYEGLVKLRLNGSTNDFILILYRDEDKLYLPVDRMSLIQKYMGVDGIKPVLDKLGGKSWERVKANVKKSTEKIAGKLLKLYAERRGQGGICL